MKSSYTWDLNTDNASEYIYDASKLEFTANGVRRLYPASPDTPYVINSEGIYFTILNKFTCTVYGTTSQEQVRFQLSNDGETWYYYDQLQTQWVESGTVSTSAEIVSGSNTANELTSSIFEKFVYDIDAGSLYWKAYLFQDVELSTVSFNYEQYYTTIKKIRQLMAPYGLRARDPNTGEYCEDEDFLSDATLKDYLILADSYLNNLLFRDFYYHRDVVEFHDGNGKESLTTYYFPITKITRVIMYNQLLQAMRTFLDSELIVHPEWGELFLPPAYPAYLSDRPSRGIFGNIFIPGKRNVEIKYDYGYETPPDDIEMAARKYIGTQVLNAYWAWITRGIQSRSFDGYSESYMQKPFTGIWEQWNKEVNDIIERRRRQFQRSI